MVEFRKDLADKAITINNHPASQLIEIKKKKVPTIRDLDIGEGNYTLYIDFYRAILNGSDKLKILKIDGKPKGVIVLEKNYKIGRDIDYYLDPKDSSIHSFLISEKGKIYHKEVMSTKITEHVKSFYTRTEREKNAQIRNVEVVIDIIREFEKKIPAYSKERLKVKLKLPTRRKLANQKKELCPGKKTKLKNMTRKVLA